MAVFKQTNQSFSGLQGVCKGISPRNKGPEIPELGSEFNQMELDSVEQKTLGLICDSQ
jgi:hypothetical protein